MNQTTHNSFPVNNQPEQATVESSLPLPEQSVHIVESPIQVIAAEVVARSHDPTLQQAATERNSHITAQDIWQPGTLHHATRLSNLSEILQHGHLATQHEAADGVYGPAHTSLGETVLNFGVPVKELPADATHSERMDALSYSRHNGADVYLHYTRPTGSYREGEESMRFDNLALEMPGGIPSTEMSAISMCNMSTHDGSTAEKTDAVRDAIVEAGFFIPVFTQAGELAYSKLDFDADMQSVKEGTYISRAKARSLQQEADNRERHIKDAQRLVEEAAQAGLSPAELQNRPPEPIDYWDGSSPM